MKWAGYMHIYNMYIYGLKYHDKYISTVIGSNRVKRDLGYIEPGTREVSLIYI